MRNYIFLWKGSVLVSEGCTTNWEWLKAAHIYSLAVWESRSMKTQFWWGHAPFQSLEGRILPCFSPRVRWLLALLDLYYLLSSCGFLLCVCLLSSWKDTRDGIYRAYIICKGCISKFTFWDFRWLEFWGMIFNYCTFLIKNGVGGEFPWWPSSRFLTSKKKKDSLLPLQGAWGQSLIGWVLHAVQPK